jgi:hypothetical protein
MQMSRPSERAVAAAFVTSTQALSELSGRQGRPVPWRRREVKLDGRSAVGRLWGYVP